jgi:hypothetical protein
VTTFKKKKKKITRKPKIGDQGGPPNFFLPQIIFLAA